MKKLLSISFLAFFTCISFGQNSTKVLGIWQAKLDGKFATGNDFGATDAVYSKKNIFIVFGKDKMYFVMASNKSSITSANMKNLISKEDAASGTYLIYDSIELIPSDIRSKYEVSKPFTDKTFFVEGAVMNNPMSFYFDVSANKFMGLSKESPILELIKVGSYN